MTPTQIELARHALGLTRSKQSYRNHFVAGAGHSDFPAWMRMVEAGDAKARHHHQLSGGSDSCFWMTEQGARKVLKKGESLCPEDFPACAVETNNAKIEP